MPEGIDYAFGRPGIAALKAAGVKFVCRYLSHSPTKNLTSAEAHALSAAGIWIVVVWETTARRALAGRTAGVADAIDAQMQAQACGMPTGRPIYFAVDWDASAGQQSAINAYLDGAASVLGRDRVGIYGGYGPVSRALDGGHAAWAWQTYAWSGGRWDSRAQLQQYSNGHTLGGVGCDYDRATRDDYGQWRVGVTPHTQEDDMAVLTSLGADGKQTISAKTHAPVLFAKQYSDRSGLFHEGKDGKGYTVFPTGEFWAVCGALFELGGLAPGATVDVTWSRMKRDAAGDFTVVGDDAWRLTYTANADGIVRAELGGQFGVDATSPVRLYVHNGGDTEVIVKSCLAKVSLLKY